MYEFIKVTINDTKNIKTLCKLIKYIWRECLSEILDKKILDYICSFIKPAVIKNEIEEGANYYFIAENDEIAGYFCYYLRNDCLYLTRIYLKENERRKNIGQFTVEKLKTIALNKNLNKIQVYIDKNALCATNAFLKWGFVVKRDVLRYIGNEYFIANYAMEYEF